MIEQADQGKPQRLEHFISLAKKGESFRLGVTLRKQVLTPKDNPEEPYRLMIDKDLYLLMGDFNFDSQGESAVISKVYTLGSVGESSGEDQEIRQVANERLKMDYQRLKAVGIVFEERYF